MTANNPKPKLGTGPVAEAGALLDRREAVKGILGDASDLLFITGIGLPKGDVTPLIGADAPNLFPTGSMGCAAMVGLGLALAQPTRRVVVVTGDGELLMNMGSLATIGVMNPPNLAILVVDNECYAETGCQQTHTGRGVDLAKVADSCGFANTRMVRQRSELAEAAKVLRQSNGATLIVAKVAATMPKSAFRVRDGVWNKGRFRQALLGRY
jgi:thiamine pyrophosphate-dependent acetolactate synthase large subunit-like protein